MSGLNGTILEQGNTFSAGEKQLFCLARAVLSPCKIVLIDEVTFCCCFGQIMNSKYPTLQATANVDAETDREIQEVIHQCLGDRTVITIAHRVDTVLGCDRVLVMEQGNIVEAGQPTALLQDATSKFSRFVSN